MVSIYDCTMTPYMTAKWQQYLEEVRLILEFSFRDAMISPEKINLYCWRLLHTATRVFEIHWFLIGHTSFCLATNDNIREILVDAALHDGEPLYPAGLIPSNFRPVYISVA